MKCWFIFFHNWLNWKDVQVNVHFENGLIMPKTKQERYCKKCNKCQIRDF